MQYYGSLSKSWKLYSSLLFLFFAALLLYESRQYENALLYLERIVSSANGSGCLPKLLNFVGCILARQVATFECVKQPSHVIKYVIEILYS